MPNRSANSNFLVDIEHLHYWMSAIRDSSDPIRTLDAFWKGQISSKLWLIQNLKPVILTEYDTNNVSVDIHGGVGRCIGQYDFSKRYTCVKYS